MPTDGKWDLTRRLKGKVEPAVACQQGGVGNWGP